MKKYVKVVLFLSLVLIQNTFALEASDLSLGFLGGYSHFNKFEAINISSGLPFSATLGMTWSERFQTKLGYQWIKSEHAGHAMATFQSVRFIPSFQIKQWNEHALNIESGLGYQYANLKNIDVVRHAEWMIGPAWSWNFLNTWSMIANAYYTRSINASFQHLDFAIGIQYKFGGSNYVQPTPFVHIDLDSDKDAVVDQKDVCPDTKRGLEVDEVGCPLLITGRGVIDGVMFEKDSPRLTISSKNVLLPIAATLKKYPKLMFVIEGYTSSNTAQRLTVSKARAMSVMNVLISYGVPESNLQAVGLGDQYPLTDSTLDEDRVLNERVEIKWKAQQRLTQR